MCINNRRRRREKNTIQSKIPIKICYFKHNIPIFFGPAALLEAIFGILSLLEADLRLVVYFIRCRIKNTFDWNHFSISETLVCKNRQWWRSGGCCSVRMVCAECTQ